MSVLEAIVLGIVQGLTEFLPVSSSGHLVLAQHLFGLDEPMLLFDVILHAATLVAICIVFRREIGRLAVELLRVPRYLKGRAAWRAAWRERPDFRMLALIVVGCIPTFIIGLSLKDLFEALFASPPAVGVALLVTGGVLFLTRRARLHGRPLSAFRASDALIIGLAQSAAITPGISRSGITISAGLFLGLDRETAARYSFLLSIPAVLGALFIHLLEAGAGGPPLGAMMVGFIAALVSGYAALVCLLKLVRRGRLHYFGYYCWAVGLATLILALGTK